MKQKAKLGKSSISALGLLVTIGIVYGDIGTSPLYVMRAIVSVGTSSHQLTPDFIIGALSCIIWTLTIQTTFKYVLISLHADNKGEGGILALYSLVKKTVKRKHLYLIAILGGATLIADGIITPSLTVMTSIEGVTHGNINATLLFTILILIGVFTLQQFGTESIGKLFGPIMFIWFAMLATFGFVYMFEDLSVLKAFNPYYAINFIIQSPYILPILGAIFLCTTGAESLYSDLGHCGIKNIQTSWIFVKICLIVNYLGQGAWVISHADILEGGNNPFFMMMPQWFIVPGVIISTCAAVIASQALITGAFSLFSEAMSLNFWPRQRVEYPAKEKGQMYLPAVNWSLMFACIWIVMHFQSSSKMEASYGLAITLTMLMTTILLAIYLKNIRKTHWALVALFTTIYITVEGGFFYSNVIKFKEGGYVVMLLSGAIGVIMYVWYNGRKLKQKYIQYIKLKPILPIIEDLQKDTSIPKFATHMAYVSRAQRKDEIDAKIIYSILQKQPKRADYYWIISVETDNKPYTYEYEVLPYGKGLNKVMFKLGFKVQPLISVYFREVLNKLHEEDKISLTSSYPSLAKYNIPADFLYVLTYRVFNHDRILSFKESITLRLYNLIKHIGISDIAALGLPSHNVFEDKVPMVTNLGIKPKKID